MTEEEFLIDRINMIRREYEKQIEPLVQRLASIREQRRPEPIIFEIASLPPGLRDSLLAHRKDDA